MGLCLVQTLEDISNLVRDITQQLRDKKVKLQPQIKDLKEARKRFQDIEANYFQKRSTYEKVQSYVSCFNIRIGIPLPAQQCTGPLTIRRV